MKKAKEDEVKKAHDKAIKAIRTILNASIEIVEAEKILIANKKTYKTMKI